MVTSADLQGTYRLLNADDVHPEEILSPHLARTRQRCAQRGTALLVHDTTTFTFSSPRAGLGRVNDGGQGFLGHFCLAVGLNGAPLGLVGFERLVRTGPTKSRQFKNRKDEDRESLRWARLALETGQSLEGQCDAIHVMDSEADMYELCAQLVQSGQRFVIRVAQNRRLVDEHEPWLTEALSAAPARLERKTLLSERRAKDTKSRSKRNQPRAQRMARLGVSAMSLKVRRPPKDPRDLPDSLPLNYVRVAEIDPPQDAEPVEWVLVTTEPIETNEQVERIVDIYRRRWVIEEFFKVLKSGCGYEKAQLESLVALERYLAMLVPVAWQLLLLRTYGLEHPDDPAEVFLTSLQLRALRLLYEGPALPLKLTCKQAMYAIAALAGHIKANGPPGWQKLGMGMKRIDDGVQMLRRLENGGEM